VVQNAPVLEFEPWHPGTLAALAESGVDVKGSYGGALPDRPDVVTYGAGLRAIVEGFPRWNEAARRDFPATPSATWLQLVISEAGAGVFEALAGGAPAFAPLYDVEELVLGRCFEYGIFPPSDLSADQLDWFLQRSVEIAAASGAEIPGRAEMMIAAREVWGGIATA
jgi:hypothetical protein